MMNMTEKRSDNSHFKTFLWKRDWARPYESVFGLMLNFCRVNVISGRAAAKLLIHAFRAIRDEDSTGKKTLPDDDHMIYDMLQSDRNKTGMQVFLNMSKST